jgi:hypothetical protein
MATPRNIRPYMQHMVELYPVLWLPLSLGGGHSYSNTNYSPGSINGFLGYYYVVSYQSSNHSDPRAGYPDGQPMVQYDIG